MSVYKKRKINSTVIMAITSEQDLTEDDLNFVVLKTEMHLNEMQSIKLDYQKRDEKRKKVKVHLRFHFNH